MDLSIVVPLYNERDNLAPLHRELDAGAGRGLNRQSYEILFVDDGSADGGIEVLLRKLKRLTTRMCG